MPSPSQNSQPQDSPPPHPDQASYKAYLINLPDAVERLHHSTNAINAIGLPMIRIEGVIGRILQLPHPDYSETSYRLLHGKRTNLGELGCYFSHIKAFEAFLQSTDSHALIVEDDTSFNPEFTDVVRKALGYAHHWDILRLGGIHSGSPIRIRHLDTTHSLCVNLTRLAGSGVYMVNRHAATVLKKYLLPMKLPYDHAYDREWLWGLKALSICPFPASQRNAFESQIGMQKSHKLPFLIRYPTVLPYRTYNEVSRILFRSLQVLKLKFRKDHQALSGTP